jgi:ATP-dependent Lon protease
MYNLRSRKIKIEEPEVSDHEDEIPSRKRRDPPAASNSRKKAQRTQFDPKKFKKGNSYDNIFDSSDSEDDHESYEPSSNDDELVEDDLEDDPEDEDQYFDLDRDPLIRMVTKRLREKFPDISELELKEAVENAIKKADELTGEYCGAIPKDVSWKIGLEDDEVEVLEPELKQLREKMQENTPTISKILKSGMPTLEKQRALRLYDALQNVEPYTLEYIDLSTRLSDMIRIAPSNVDASLDQQLNVLRSKMEQKVPTIEKITAALIPESDKIRALQLYDILQQAPYNTDSWFNIQHRINQILDNQFKSPEEVAQIEQEENALKMKTFNFHADLKRQIFELDADDDIKARIYEMYADMISRGADDSRYNDLRSKILWALRLPYRRRLIPSLKTETPEEIRIYCREVYSRLNAEIYGMQEAKERIIQAVNDQVRNPKSRTILALKGKPGVGKTKLAKTVANAVGRPFDKISLGGAIDSTIFKGSDNVWSGATPSLLLQILSRVKYSNAVILLDEIDKLGVSEKGREVQHALLHILDPTQNREVQDAFLNEFSHDFSNIWFICALNDDKDLDPALRDRLNIIKVPSYSQKEMTQIIIQHTLPEALSDKGISIEDLTISESGAQGLLNLLGTEIQNSGMRPVERAINDVVSKINLLQTLGHDTSEIPLSYNVPDFHGFPYTITEKTLQYLMKDKSSPRHDSMYL